MPKYTNHRTFGGWGYLPGRPVYHRSLFERRRHAGHGRYDQLAVQLRHREWRFEAIRRAIG